MAINVILVPYDSSRRAWRMGSGPDHLLQNGLETSLRVKGHILSTTWIETQDPSPSEIKTAFELYRELAEQVYATCAAGDIPLVLSGNCGAALGTVSGISNEPVGVIWFDAHGDFNTPETTRSGYLDGMGLAALCGLCWKGMTNAIPHFRPIPTQRVLLIGGTDIDPEEGALMRQSGVRLVATPAVVAHGWDAVLTPALDALKAEVKNVYVHFDLDVLDPRITPANLFAVPDGLPVEAVKEAVRMIHSRFNIRAVGVASYDPSCDPNGATLRAGIELVETALG